MSHTTIVTIHCDQCGVWEECSSGSGRDAKRYAASRKRRGWTKRDGDDFCPDCSKSEGSDQ